MSDKFRVVIDVEEGASHYARYSSSEVLCGYTGSYLTESRARAATCEVCKIAVFEEIKRDQEVFFTPPPSPHPLPRYEEVFLKILYRIPPLKGADDAVKMADRRASAALKHLKEREP